MTSERVMDPNITSASTWSVGSGARFISEFGDFFIAFGRAGSNAVGQTAQTNFTAVSGESYNVSFTLNAQNFGGQLSIHVFRAEIIDLDTGQVISQFQAPGGTNALGDNPFPIVRNGQTKTVDFSFSGQHSGDLAFRLTATQTFGTLTNSDGNLRSLSIIGPDPALVPCFTRGTLIQTDMGERPVESLQIGDLVQTVDHGFQQVRWVGRKLISPSVLRANPKLVPIRIAAHALGHNVPETDLIVSPQHRMLISSKIVARMTGEREILVPAVKLLGVEGVSLADDVQVVEYFHILLNGHEVIFANGAKTESLLVGPYLLQNIGAAAVNELLEFFPEVLEADYSRQSARIVVQKNKTVRQLTYRHQKNEMPLSLAH